MIQPVEVQLWQGRGEVGSERGVGGGGVVGDIVSAIPEITKNFLKNTKIILFSQKYKNIHLYVFQIYDLRNSLYLELKSVVQNARSVSLTVQPRDPTPFQYDAKNIYIFIFLLVKYNKTHCHVLYFVWTECTLVMVQHSDH